MKHKARTMTHDSKRELKPKLRFPKFRDAPPWEETTVGTLLCARQEKQLPSDDVPLFSLTIEDGVTAKSDRYNREFLVRKSSEKQYKVVRPNDIVYNPSNLRWGAINRSKLNHSVVVSPIYEVLYLANNEVGYLPFISNALMRPEQIQRFITKAQGTLVERIAVKIESFLETTLAIPPILEEQLKIADCLSSVDDLIAAHSLKLDLLKAHKKGLMQQLFPREGETLPRFRFPEFQAAGKWEEKKLEDLAKRGSGHTPNKAKEEYYNGGIKWVSLADSKRLDNGLISDTEIEISELGIEHSSAVLRPAGSVILSRDAGVGKSAIMGVSMAVSQHFIVWTCDSRKLSNWFLYYILQKKKPLFERVASGSTIRTIGLPFFIELRITAPLLPEQQRIADCLSSVDDLIAAQSQKLDALKTHKKALMQQLFPLSDEVEA